jgi:ketosteroid isomerase-like protein
LTLVLSLVLISCGSDSDTVSGEDLETMRSASRAYMEAWLSNDPEAVMATFEPEPVLSPSGLPFLEGQEAARGFWWPEGSPPTTVTTFDYRQLEARASGDIGYVRGTHTLVFEYAGKTYTNRGKYLHILHRNPEKEWRISHHFWDDFPAVENR